MKIKLILLILLLAAITGLFIWRHGDSKPAVAEAKAASAGARKAVSDKKATAAQPTVCDSLTAQTVVVSLSRQHLWACDDQKVAYDSAVITGMEQYDDSTPLGTYHIYSKLTDQTLKGCDPTGCWNDFVNYWMPYQQASGGTVGFHDATWRQASEFGNTPPASDKGSHGCVELPFATAKWLFNWSSIGTTVTIES